MPDIREILAALDIDDRALWSEHRTIMRRSYLNAHNETVGMGKWSHEDDAFLDLIDIRLALLFDRAGRLQATTDILGQDQKEAIESDLVHASDKMKEIWSSSKVAIVNNAVQSQASKLLSEGFSTEWPTKQ